MLNKTTDLTLAICVYNAEHYLDDTLASVLSQTDQDFDLLIVNDCSTDKSLAVVDSFFREHPRPHEVISFDTNRGIGYARHFAERHADTRYMMFLDADDILYPQAVEKMHRQIRLDPDLMAVGCYLDYMDRAGNKIRGGIYLGAKTKAEFYDRASRGKRFFMPITTIYDRALALSVGGFTVDGFPEGRPRYQDYCEDLDLWTRMSDLYTQGKAIVVVPEVLGRYRKAAGLSSGTLPMILKMHYVKENLRRRRAGVNDQTFTEFYAAMPAKTKKRLQRDAQATEHLRSGLFYLHQRRPLRAISQILKSVICQPSSIWDKLIHNLIPHK